MYLLGENYESLINSGDIYQTFMASTFSSTEYQYLYSLYISSIVDDFINYYDTPIARIDSNMPDIATSGEFALNMLYQNLYMSSMVDLPNIADSSFALIQQFSMANTALVHIADNIQSYLTDILNPMMYNSFDTIINRFGLSTQYYDSNTAMEFDIIDYSINEELFEFTTNDILTTYAQDNSAYDFYNGFIFPQNSPTYLQVTEERKHLNFYYNDLELSYTDSYTLFNNMERDLNILYRNLNDIYWHEIYAAKRTTRVINSFMIMLNSFAASSSLPFQYHFMLQYLKNHAYNIDNSFSDSRDRLFPYYFNNFFQLHPKIYSK